MAIGRIKGDDPLNEDQKLDLIKHLNTKSHIEKTGLYGNYGFWTKIKDFKYKFYYMPNKMLACKPIPFERGKDDKKHFEGNYLVVQMTGKYFHDMLEIVPQIITLKKEKEDFKILLIGNQKIDPETKMFYGLNPEDNTGHQPISYWRDILKYLNIEFECFESKPGTSFSTSSNYLFYYTDLGSKKTTGLGPGLKKHYPTIFPELLRDDCHLIYPLLYFTTLIHADSYDILSEYLNPLFRKVIPGKKIFITRDSVKFEDRSIENSRELTNYMASKGFQILGQENLPWTEQIKEVTSAQYIVSLVGSGFINAMFCGPETTMISIHTDKSQEFLVYGNQVGRTDSDFKTVYCDSDGLDIINYFENSKSPTTRKVIDG